MPRLNLFWCISSTQTGCCEFENLQQISAVKLALYHYNMTDVIHTDLKCPNNQLCFWICVNAWLDKAVLHQKAHSSGRRSKREVSKTKLYIFASLLFFYTNIIENKWFKVAGVMKTQSYASLTHCTPFQVFSSPFPCVTLLLCYCEITLFTVETYCGI